MAEETWVIETDGGMLYIVAEPSRRVVALLADDGRALTEGLEGTIEDAQRIVQLRNDNG